MNFVGNIHCMELPQVCDIPHGSANNPSSQCFYYPNRTTRTVCWRKAKRSVERAGPCNWRPWMKQPFFVWWLTPVVVYSVYYTHVLDSINQIFPPTKKPSFIKISDIWLSVSMWPGSQHVPTKYIPNVPPCATKWHLSTNSSTPPAAKVLGCGISQYDNATTCKN